MATTRRRKPGLYIAADGRVECHEHTPFPGSDTWVSGDYLRITGDARELLTGQPLRCEVCGRTRAEAEAAA
jgi:hypothetical protein